MSSKGTRFCRLGIVLGTLVLLALPLAALAQNYDNPGLGEKPVATHPQDYKPLGIRAGSFMLHPGLQLAAEYTDNVFYTDSDTVSDTVWHVRPYLTGQSNWTKHSFNVRLAADIARYQDYGYRDYEDYFLVVTGRLDVRNRSYFSYGADYMQLHEGLDARYAEQGIVPTVYDMYGGSIGYDHTFNRLSLGVHLDQHWMNFDDTLGLDGETIIDNLDRDRRVSSIRLRAGYQFQTDKQVFAQLATHDVKYDQPLDRNGFERSSDGWVASGGLKFTLTNLLNGDLYVSYHEQSYDDPTLPDVTGWALGAGLSWTPTLLTTVAAKVSSGIQETTYDYSSGYFGTVYSLRADHELMRNLQLSGQVSYRDNDYQLIEGAPPDARTRDKVWQAGVGLNYYVNRYLFVSAAYTYDHLDSSVPNDDYDVNRFWLTLGLER